MLEIVFLLMHEQKYFILGQMNNTIGSVHALNTADLDFIPGISYDSWGVAPKQKVFNFKKLMKIYITL